MTAHTLLSITAITVKMQASDAELVYSCYRALYNLSKCHVFANVVHAGISCRDGDVRLVNGSRPYEGRIDVCFNETWGTVCGSISPWSWNHSQADIVCRQLGYSQAGERNNYIYQCHSYNH